MEKHLIYKANNLWCLCGLMHTPTMTVDWFEVFQTFDEAVERMNSVVH